MQISQIFQYYVAISPIKILSGGDEDDGIYLYRHMLHYDDELLRDFGASPRRKTGFFPPLKELIDP